MKNTVIILVAAFAFFTKGYAQNNMKDQHVKTIALEQTPGAFTQKSVTVAEGDYIFEVANNAGIDVGFALVPKGKDISDPKNHIKTAYVTSLVKNGSKETSNVTTLQKGAYVYFCPLNATPQYTLIVE